MTRVTRLPVGEARYNDADMTRTETDFLDQLLAVAQDGAYLAGCRTLAYFNTGVVPDIKSDLSPVTIADREAEQVLRARIRQSFADHAILGEEEGEDAATEGAAVRWIVDPIDGTKAFVTGVPLYGVLVGVEVEGVASVGVIYIPATGDMIAARTGGGATWNGRPCRVSDVSDLKNALVVTSSIRRCQGRSDAFENLAKRTRLQRTWGDAFGYALVATGRAEMMLDPAMKPWDCAPMLPILTEAGGRFSDWRGSVTIHGADAFGTNGALYEEVLAILREG